MVAGETIVTYETGRDCLDQIQRCLADWTAAKKMADNGRRQIGDLYTKERQWALFNMIVARL
jgi:spore maturation protein CgeB